MKHVFGYTAANDVTGRIPDVRALVAGNA